MLILGPFADFSVTIDAEALNFYTDAAKNFGMGGYCNKAWMYQAWNREFIKNANPSINYLELIAVTVAITMWIEKFSNSRIAVFCDNKSVCDMINDTASKCKKLHGITQKTGS